MMCDKCSKLSAWAVLVLGLALLAVDLGYWTFWNIGWASALVFIYGLSRVLNGSCQMCK